MTTQEKLFENQKDIKNIENIMYGIRMNHTNFRTNVEYQELDKQLSAYLNIRRTLQRQAYVESLNCKECEDTGMISQCCADNDCQGNVICYACDVHLKNEED